MSKTIHLVTYNGLYDRKLFDKVRNCFYPCFAYQFIIYIHKKIIEFWCHLEYEEGAFIFTGVHERKRTHRGKKLSITIPEFLFFNIRKRLLNLSKNVTMMIESDNLAETHHFQTKVSKTIWNGTCSFSLFKKCELKKEDQCKKGICESYPLSLLHVGSSLETFEKKTL